MNQRLGIDPILTAILVLPAFYALGAAVYQVYYVSFEKRGQEALRGLAFFFGLLFVTEVLLILVFGVDYRYVQADYIDRTLRFRGLRHSACACSCPASSRSSCSRALQLFLTRTFIGRAIMAVSQDQLALQLMAADPIRIKRIAFAISIATASIAGALLIVIQPVEPSVGREYIGRVFAICVLGGLGSLPGTADRRHAARHHRKPDRDLLRPVMGAGGRLRLPAADACVPSRPGSWGGDDAQFACSSPTPSLPPAPVYALARIVNNDYLFFAGYVVLQFVVLATAWNILGGYCGYVNFGSAAFFALGAYTTVSMVKFPALAAKYFPEWLAALVDRDFPAADSRADPARRRHRRPCRAWHRLSHVAAARRLFFHRHAWRSRSCCRHWS